MDLYSVILISVAAIAFAFACWLVFWTDSAVKFAQAHSIAQHSNITSEPWYPMWLRFEGMWLWVMLAFFLTALLKG